MLERRQMLRDRLAGDGQLVGEPGKRGWAVVGQAPYDAAGRVRERREDE